MPTVSVGQIPAPAPKPGPWKVAANEFCRYRSLSTAQPSERTFPTLPGQLTPLPCAGQGHRALGKTVGLSWSLSQHRCHCDVPLLVRTRGGGELCPGLGEENVG